MAKPPARPHQFQRHLYDRTQPETLAFIARLRAQLDRYGAMAVGEIEDEEALKVQRDYTDGPDCLHTAYSFFLLRTRVATPAPFVEAMQGWQGARGWPSWSLSNHDVIRFPTRLAGDDPQRVKQLLTLLLCLRGTAFLYQGDELGLPHAEVPFERLRDPEAIAFWPSGIGRDGARTPMPWISASPIAGFTTAPDAWLPLDPRHRALAVDVEENDPDSVLVFTRKLIAFRRASAALREGAFTLIQADESILALQRASGEERVLCLFNLVASPQIVSVGENSALAFSVGDVALSPSSITLSGYSAALLQVAP